MSSYHVHWHMVSFEEIPTEWFHPQRSNFRFTDTAKLPSRRSSRLCPAPGGPHVTSLPVSLSFWDSDSSTAGSSQQGLGKKSGRSGASGLTTEVWDSYQKPKSGREQKGPLRIGGSDRSEGRRSNRGRNWVLDVLNQTPADQSAEPGSSMVGKRL